MFKIFSKMTNPTKIVQYQQYCYLLYPLRCSHPFLNEITKLIRHGCGYIFYGRTSDGYVYAGVERITYHSFIFSMGQLSTYSYDFSLAHDDNYSYSVTIGGRRYGINLTDVVVYNLKNIDASIIDVVYLSSDIRSSASASYGSFGYGFYAGGLISGLSVNTVGRVNIRNRVITENFGMISTPLYELSGTSDGDGGRAIFSGGRKLDKSPTDAIEIFNMQSGGYSNFFGSLPTSVSCHASICNGRFRGDVMFVCGDTSSENEVLTNKIQYTNINASEVSVILFGSLSSGLKDHCAYSDGYRNRAVVWGGKTDSELFELDIMRSISFIDGTDITEFSQLYPVRTNSEAISDYGESV